MAAAAITIREAIDMLFADCNELFVLIPSLKTAISKL